VTRIRVIRLMGATGTGKTEAALALAGAFGGAVVNVDSRQVYAGLAVLTAQPTVAEQARCPHALYGDTPLSEPVAAGDFARRARAAVADFTAKGFLPLLVGGTGLYFRAIAGGLAPIPPVPAAVRQDVRRQWDSLGPAAMHARLTAVDPEYAAKIAPNDRQRVTRALEVLTATGKPLSAWHREPDPEAPDYDSLTLGLGLPLADLAPRLAVRIEAMVRAGAVEEVRQALETYPETVPGLSGIGGPELSGFLAGRLDLEAAKAAWLANTRAYAKRQMTWFRKEPDIQWFAPGEHQVLLEVVRAWLDRSAA